MGSMEVNQTKVVDPLSVHFSVFNSRDIKELSVLRITTPLTFDALGHPLKGGLYDPVLGPINEKGDPCKTCFRTIDSCPGHFGHIDLPMPVINPLFHKIMFTILQNSCLSCNKFQLNNDTRKLLILKLQLVNMGLITNALDADQVIPELNRASRDPISDEKIFKKYLKVMRIKNKNTELLFNKNSYKFQDKFISEALKTSKQKICIYCKETLIRIQKVNSKLIYSIFHTENNKMVKKNASLMPDSSKKHLRKLWDNDKELLREIVPVLKNIQIDYPTDIFFLDIIPVPPPLVRPCNILKGQLIEHPQTQVYKMIIKTNFIIRAIIQMTQNDKNNSDITITDEIKSIVDSTTGSDPLEKLHYAWQELQINVDHLLNSENTTGGEQGLKQVIEKKEGVIRMHMMGKRVNFAARSVITPDPNINIEEIGIPEAFAIKLSYPVPVTSWNVEELRKMVINGPNKHPGALTIENEDGKVVNIPSWSLHKREGLAMRLLTPSENKVKNFKTVHRHLINGDVMLLNRQPTLHKPSIMAHRARILKGEKTLRLHYANCKAYNADFDGDEMNAHFPQNEIARSEAYNIMNVSNQYLVPKDGTPLGGLIQDHVISGVKLSLRGKFFSRSDYQQLVFQGLSHLQKKIKLLPPAIIKPQKLWSGKQVLSTLIINITPDNKEPITLVGTAKISPRAWQTERKNIWRSGGNMFVNDYTMSESEVIIRCGELLSGVLDKNHYGATPYSLIHCYYELFGGIFSSVLLSSFAKLFTFYLQWEGFTLGVKDILVVPKADKTRAQVIENCRNVGNATAAETVGLDPDVDQDELIRAIEIANSKDVKFKAALDRSYKSTLDKFTNSINKACLPLGLLEQFPANNLQLMVQSGAKGSTVNTMQISCLLGQIELEGKRPPLMVSGRSLPSFPPFETSPRSGGFIDGRFMTGIQPQEFFFHCMAGREGLIDTAVKTSKSGYLQRCLIKHLEGITVKYDNTVRDSDDSIIQFAYGEDGMDVCKSQYFNEKQLTFLDMNTNAILNKDNVEILKEASDNKAILKHTKTMKKWKKIHENLPKRSNAFNNYVNDFKGKNTVINARSFDGRDITTCNLMESWFSAESDLKDQYTKKYNTKKPDPIVSVLSSNNNFGVINEKLTNLMENYLKNRHGSTNLNHTLSKPEDFKDMIAMKANESMAAPGEPVGLLAAQSIGEPSTQMTLNTFHFAGRGDMNVTLGIPRLREILMTASDKLKTPSMDVPFKKDIADFNNKAEKLQIKFCKVTVENILHKIDVKSQLKLFPEKTICYMLHFHFLPHHMYKNLYNLTPKKIMRYMEQKFFSFFMSNVWRATGRKMNLEIDISGETKGGKNNEDDDENEVPSQPKKKGLFNEENESSDEDGGNDDDDTTQVRSRNRHTERQEYDDPETEEEELSDAENNILDTKGELEDEGFEEDIKPNIHTLQLINKIKEISDYTYDEENYLWCKLVFSLPLTTAKIDMAAIIKSSVQKSIIIEVPNIKRAIIYPNNSGESILKTEGINIAEMYKYHDLLDLNRLYSNDIHAIAKTYGIEAACKVIIKEVQNVFGVYGIKVDLRHLSLISDYMTYNGIFEPLSRKGMEASTSPLQQMTFESSLTFLKDAVIKGKADGLQSASSCLMVGQPCKSGTGSFTLLNSYNFDSK